MASQQQQQQQQQQQEIPPSLGDDSNKPTATIVRTTTAETIRFWAIRVCESLQSPAIFTDWDDCRFYLDQEENESKVEWSEFDSGLQALNYICSSIPPMKDTVDGGGGDGGNSSILQASNTCTAALPNQSAVARGSIAFAQTAPIQKEQQTKTTTDTPTAALPNQSAVTGDLMVLAQTAPMQTEQQTKTTTDTPTAALPNTSAVTGGSMSVAQTAPIQKTQQTKTTTNASATALPNRTAVTGRPIALTQTAPIQIEQQTNTTTDTSTRKRPASDDVDPSSTSMMPNNPTKRAKVLSGRLSKPDQMWEDKFYVLQQYKAQHGRNFDEIENITIDNQLYSPLPHFVKCERQRINIVMDQERKDPKRIIVRDREKIQRLADIGFGPAEEFIKWRNPTNGRYFICKPTNVVASPKKKAAKKITPPKAATTEGEKRRKSVRPTTTTGTKRKPKLPPPVATPRTAGIPIFVPPHETPANIQAQGQPKAAPPATTLQVSPPVATTRSPNGQFTTAARQEEERDAVWEDRFQKLKEYHEQNGSLRGVSALSRDQGNFSILPSFLQEEGQKITRLKKVAKNDPKKVPKKDIDRIKRMANLGFEEAQSFFDGMEVKAAAILMAKSSGLNTTDTRWEINFDRLRRYKEKYGTYVMSKKHEPIDEKLQAWVQGQKGNMRTFDSERSSNKKRNWYFTEEKYNRLKGLGLVAAKVCTPPPKLSWDEFYEQLQKFHEENGHVNVPRNIPLGKWIARQRDHFEKLKKFEKSDLTNERLMKLTQIGVELQVERKQPFEVSAAEWLDYRTKHGKDPPLTTKLGQWVCWQRKKYENIKKGKNNRKMMHLPDEHIALLDSWGFKWDSGYRKPHHKREIRKRQQEQQRLQQQQQQQQQSDNDDNGDTESDRSEGNNDHVATSSKYATGGHYRYYW